MKESLLQQYLEITSLASGYSSPKFFLLGISADLQVFYKSRAGESPALGSQQTTLPVFEQRLLL